MSFFCKKKALLVWDSRIEWTECRTLVFSTHAAFAGPQVESTGVGYAYIKALHLPDHIFDILID